jgi:hypothetical protein
MSISDAPGYATEDDVQAALQETDAAFQETPLGSTNVENAVKTASRWLKRKSDSHWYDSNAGSSSLLSSSPATATDLRMDVPSSPHAQQGALFRSDKGAYGVSEYPVTHAGQYARATTAAGEPRIPAKHVEAIDALRVREFGGDVTDWVASSDIQQGRGEDYYLVVDGKNSGGRSYLYIHAGSLGARHDYEDVLTVDVTYGQDWQDGPWADVRRGVAHLAAAELVQDDDVLTSIPDGVALSNVDTQVQLHLDRAFDTPGYLDTYVEGQIA